MSIPNPTDQAGLQARIKLRGASRSAEASSRPAPRITWTGIAAYGSGGPSSVEDMFVTGEADFTRSPLPIRAAEYFVRQTR